MIGVNCPINDYEETDCIKSECMAWCNGGCNEVIALKIKAEGEARYDWNNSTIKWSDRAIGF